MNLKHNIRRLEQVPTEKHNTNKVTPTCKDLGTFEGNTNPGQSHSLTVLVKKIV